MIVDAPRSFALPALCAMAARMAAGSYPSLSQKLRSSAVVVASRTSLGTWSKAMIRRSSWAKRPSSILPVRS